MPRSAFLVTMVLLELENDFDMMLFQQLLPCSLRIKENVFVFTQIIKIKKENTKLQNLQDTYLKCQSYLFLHLLHEKGALIERGLLDIVNMIIW